MLKRSLWLIVATFLCLVPAQAWAACDYEIGELSQSNSQIIIDTNEELECLQDAISAGVPDGDKGAITVSGSGLVWNIDANAVGSSQIATDAVGADELNASAVESELEAVLDVDDLQGAAAYLKTAAVDTSAELRGILGDEVGTGAAMFGLAPGMADDLSCTGSQVVRRNAGDSAFECATVGGVNTTDIDTSSELRAIVTDEVGTGALMFGIAANMSDDISCGASQYLQRNGSDNGWQCATGVGGLAGTDIDTSAELRTLVTDEVGTGALMFGLDPDMADGLSCSASQVVRRNAGDTAFECATISGGGGGGMADLVDDTSPQLGGDLDLNGFDILGMVIGADVEAWDADLDAVAALTTSAAGLDFLELVDPDASRIAFWNDADGAAKWLEVLSPLSISGDQLDVLPASTSQDGACELATTAEAAAQTDTTRCLTPEGLKYKREALPFPLSDETTTITSGAGKFTIRMPFGFQVTEVRASLKTASSSGTVTVDINENGSSILGTKLTIDSGEKTSTTAASAATITDDTLSDDAEMTFDIDGAGTNAVGLKVYIIGHQL